MGIHRQLQKAERELGQLLEAHRDPTDREEFGRYRDDPVGFIRDVVGEEPWEGQVRIAEAVRVHPLVTVRSCHAAGKDWLASRLATWWCYAREGLVVLTGPTAAQVEEILMRGELRDAFVRASLPGDLHVNALRPRGEGRAGILAKTATGVSALTGFHEARVLFVITEAQDPELAHAFDAAFAVATGEHDRILTLGNPTEQSGRFYRSHQPRSEWHAIKIAASDVPNVREGETVVPGLLTREGVDRFAAEYGEDSPFYVSRVLAEFPAQSEAGLLRRDWLEAAADRHEDGRRDGEELVAGLDVARYGADRTVLCIREGARVTAFLTWGQKDTTETFERARDGLLEAGFRSADRPHADAVGTVAVDCIGLGAGVADRLEEEGFRVVEYKASHAPRDGDKFANLRAESYWAIRDALEAGEIHLPRSEELFTELLAVRWAPTPAGKVQIEAKKELRSRLNRSPDLADALAMCWHPKARGRPPRRATVVHR